jgi:hypothetical protein
VIGVDVGGTCTDCVMFLAGGRIQIGKALSTPPDFGDGVLDAARGAARAAGMSLAELLGGGEISATCAACAILPAANGASTRLLTAGIAKFVQHDAVRSEARASLAKRLLPLALDIRQGNDCQQDY